MKSFILLFFMALLMNGMANNTVVLITGASKGIGLATAKLLAKKGYTVYGTTRDISPPTNHPVKLITLDVTDLLSIQNAISYVVKNEGRIDILINNAGNGLGGPVECLTMDEIKDQMDVNFYGVIRMCQEVLPFMRKQEGGRIINISSYQGVWGLPFGSLYSASKAATEAISEALYIEMKPWNIFTSIVEPGHTATQFAVKIGSRIPSNNPYQKICEKLSLFQESKSESPTSIPDCQSPEEIAESIYQILNDPYPKLRYQTSPTAEKMVLLKLKEQSGDQYVEEMDHFIKTFLQN